MDTVLYCFGRGRTDASLPAHALHVGSCTFSTPGSLAIVLLGAIGALLAFVVLHDRGDNRNMHTASYFHHAELCISGTIIAKFKHVLELYGVNSIF
jgi:hypothetical protein